MNYYRRFPGDYLRDTAHLTFSQHGAYSLLLDYAYTSEKPLNSDRVLIYKLLRSDSADEQAAIDFVLDNFFQKTRWGYIHKRVREEIRHVKSRVKTAKQNGKLGGRPKTQRVSFGLAKPNPEKSSPSPSPSPETTYQHPLMQKLGVSLSLFLEYREVRERTHHPIIPGAEDLIFAELLEFQNLGESPAEVLQQAVRTGSWKLCSTKTRKAISANEKQERTSEAKKRVLQKFDSSVV